MIFVLASTVVSTSAALVRYRWRLAFLRHVYDLGGRKDLCAAAQAIRSRPAVLRRRCPCHQRLAEVISISERSSDQSVA